MWTKLLARDAGLVLAAGLLWHLLAARSAGDGWQADLAGVTAGFAVGIAAFLLHEWGHGLAALLAGSHLRPASSLHSPFRFQFDSRRNGRGQFLAMSLGGFLVTAAALGVAYGLLPDGWLATRIARGMVGFLALLGIVLELPLFLQALVTGRVPDVEVLPADPASAPRA